MGILATASSFALVCHPAAISPVVRGVSVAIEFDGAATLRLSYSIRGDVDRIRVPARGAARRADELWRTTCCEIFLRPQGDPGYFELNLSPSRAWAVYRFAGYRSGRQPVEVAEFPRITVRESAQGIELEAVVSLTGWLAQPRSPHTAVGLSAVVEDDAVHSCWALGHYCDRPDFHDSRSFVAALESAITLATSSHA